VPSQPDLEAAHCWEKSDVVPGRPEMTRFRRAARLRQARWREAHGHPMGTQPIVPKPGGPPARPVGSRLPLDYAQETGATFVTPAALAQGRARAAAKEPNHRLDAQRLWADLLWASAFSVNLFADLAADHARADRAVRAWWPDTPGRVADVRFEHSPGRLDAAYLNTLVDWNAAFVLDLGDGRQGVVAVAAAYWDRLEHHVAKPARLARYVEVAERSGAFKPGFADALDHSDLLVMWLQHLLVHSLLQHPGGDWAWGRLVVVHPAGNTDFSEGCERYRSWLADDSTFASMTMEDVLGSGLLPRPSVRALGDRYLVG
jgi:hypothetical protein